MKDTSGFNMTTFQVTTESGAEFVVRANGMEIADGLLFFLKRPDRVEAVFPYARIVGVVAIDEVVQE